ncbi:acyltransferase family protein [Roseateles asaccharophilus]|uniref:Peptidoglycan/LPS O-acetylase OafA/YrhL n=1 Tax=Roseateles asaccharophilus TaxID=582607 RepID=A0ABU2ADD2_9BURK|nr:acyltransferase family protein [Roseateles asaccharophilus]MDR7334603.1 peptidoglycan/LPS O-acetylase OafA/YrhL [Roseateles asaccharophilus]
MSAVVSAAGTEARPAVPQARSTSFNPGLQGMRGLAISLVLLNHASVPGFAGGFVGVDVFFVISGYLIGGLLLRELETHGTIDLWAFFGRRVRRLLPASALALVVTLVGMRYLYAPHEQDELLSSMRAAALYAVNIWFASRPTDYFGGHTEANPLLHLWSLAVEEQFYLLWPLLLLAVVRLTGRGARHATFWLVAVLGVTSLVACVVVSLIKYKLAFFLTPFRIWEFAAGMAVMGSAHLVANLNKRWVTGLGLTALLALVLVSLTFDGRMRFPGGWAVIPVLAAVMLLVVVQRGRQSLVGRWLEARWLRWLGDCSYSVYLWHWPVLIVATQFFPKPDPWLTVALLAVSIALGRLSYRLVEQPFLHGLLQDWSARRIVLAGLALCIMVAVAAQLTRKFVHVTPEQGRFLKAAKWTVVDSTECLTLAPALDQPACEFGSKQPRATVVLFGDSHASQWFVPLQHLAEKHGLRLVALTKAACPSVDVTVQVYTTLNEYRECTIWRERMLKRIEAMKPEVVVMANSSGYSIVPKHWQAGLDRTITRLQGMGVRIGYIRDTPFPGFDVPTCHARSAWRGWSLGQACTYLVADDEARLSPIAQVEEIALKQRGATFINLAASMCSAAVCETARDGMVMFMDRNHLTEDFALSLAPQLESPLLQLVNAPTP